MEFLSGRVSTYLGRAQQERHLFILRFDIKPVFVGVDFVEIFVGSKKLRSLDLEDFLFWPGFLIAHADSFLEVGNIGLQKVVKGHSELVVELFSTLLDFISFLGS